MKTRTLIKELCKKQILESYYAELQEVAFHRIFGKYFDDGFIAISANRSCEAELGVEKCSLQQKEEQEKKNRKNLISLKKIVRAAGYGFVPVRGGYPEEMPDGTTIEVEEPSLIIPDNKNDPEKLKAFGVTLARKFNQDSVLWKPPSSQDKSAYLIDQTGNEVMDFGGIKPNDFGNVFYSYLEKGNPQTKRWSLTENKKLFIPKVPGNIMSAMGRQGELFFFAETGLPFSLPKTRTKNK